MKRTAGFCIRSTAAMDDPIFKNSIVFITRLDEDGAIGFLINKIFPKQLNDLVEFRHSPDFPLYDGGPVDREHLFFIHRRPDLIFGSNAITTDVYEGGDFATVVHSINNGLIDITDLKIFVGYCGWDAGELDAEIAEGSWEIVAPSVEEVFR